MKNLLLKSATLFGLGNIGFAPGTFGSIAGLAIGLLVSFNFVALCGLTVFFAIFGTLASDEYAHHFQKDDPSEVIIDEVAGMLLLLAMLKKCAFLLPKITAKMVPSYEQYLSFLNSIMTADKLIYILTSFILFRLFDILKPFPISFLDKKIKGGIGIMLDDLAAAIFAFLSIYLIYVLIG